MVVGAVLVYVDLWGIPTSRISIIVPSRIDGRRVCGMILVRILELDLCKAQYGRFQHPFIEVDLVYTVCVSRCAQRAIGR